MAVKRIPWSALKQRLYLFYHRKLSLLRYGIYCWYWKVTDSGSKKD